MNKMNRRVKFDILIISVILVASFCFFCKVDALESIVEFSSQHEEYEVDELLSTLIVFSFCITLFSIRRYQESRVAKKSLIQKNNELQNALNEIQQLKGILPLCSFCKKIRNDAGNWEQVDVYIQKNSNADISHGICPICMQKHYPEEFKEIYSKTS